MIFQQIMLQYNSLESCYIITILLMKLQEAAAEKTGFTMPCIHAGNDVWHRRSEGGFGTAENGQPEK